jgi:hypothetical protein
MRYFLILITCMLLPMTQDGQGKKPSLPPLPEAEVPAPPGLKPDSPAREPAKTPGSQPATPSATPAKAGTEGQASPKIQTPDGAPTRRPGVGKLQRSIMGVWRVLPSASLGGNARKSVKGYLIITRAHLSFQLIQESTGENSSFQTGVRTYAILGKQLVTNALQGLRNGKEAGKILLDPIGHREFRKFVLLAPNVLRLIHPDGQVLEFQRVEQL